MIELNHLRLSKLVGMLDFQLMERGVYLRQERDFKKLEAILAKTKKNKLTEHFRRSLNTYTPPQAFWLGGFDDQENLIAVAAARLDDLGSWHLLDYWREYWSRCYPAANGRAVVMADEQYNFAKSVTGRVAYLAEMWVDNEFETQGVAGLFAKTLQFLAAHEWNPDWYYAWTRPGFASRGFPSKCGFAHVHPGIIWADAPVTIDPDLKVMMNAASDIRDLAQYLELSSPLGLNDKTAI